MGSEMISAALLAQRAVMAAPGGKPANTPKRALALAGASSCRSLYKLKRMDFSNFTLQQNIAIATKLLSRSARWFSKVKNKAPTTGNYLELRFFVDSFLKIAKDSGAYDLYDAIATPIYIPNKATYQQVKRGIKLFMSELKKAKRMVPPNYAKHKSSIDKFIGLLGMLSRSAYLAVGWSWLVASDRVIKTNLHHCK